MLLKWVKMLHYGHDPDPKKKKKMGFGLGKSRVDPAKQPN